MNSLRHIILLLLTLATLTARAQAGMADQPFKGHYFCRETGLHMVIDLYEPTLEAPGFSFLGKMHGYMQGGIYGTWKITRFKIKDNKATLRFSNDIGSDSQDIEFCQLTDSTYSYRAVNGNAIRRAEGRKLVKVTGEMEFVRVD